jgi:hypothetical protein
MLKLRGGRLRRLVDSRESPQEEAACGTADGPKDADPADPRSSERAGYTRLGASLSALTLAAVACVALANTVRFVSSNITISSSMQPAYPGSIAAFGSYLPFVLAADGTSTDETLPQALGGLTSGLLVLVRASGANCAGMTDLAFDLDRGTFAHRVAQDAASGEARHSFLCADCVPHDLSSLRFALHKDCEASAIITVAAVGAWGSITATSQMAGGRALGGTVRLTVPITYEVLQDLSGSQYASALAADDGSLIAAGRSARGLSVGASTDYLLAPPTGDTSNGPVAFIISLPRSSSFVLARLSLATLWSDYVATIVGLAGFVPLGGVVFIITVAASRVLWRTRGQASPSVHAALPV